MKHATNILYLILTVKKTRENPRAPVLGKEIDRVQISFNNGLSFHESNTIVSKFCGAVVAHLTLAATDSPRAL